jgi:hypothetical protein
MTLRDPNVFRLRLMLVLALAVASVLLGAAPAQAAPAPAWRLGAAAMPTNLAPGFSEDSVWLVARNAGGAPTSGSITLSDTLPAELTPTKAVAIPSGGVVVCSVVAPTVSCTTGEQFQPGETITVLISVQAQPLSTPDTVVNQASVEGGGAVTASAVTPFTISSTPASFDFLDGEAGFATPLNEDDGAAAVLAGSHPYQLTSELGFPSEPGGGSGGGEVLGAGHLRDVTVDLPRGEFADPAATPRLCHEAQLATDTCPDGAQIGYSQTTTWLLQEASIAEAAVYNMVPPPGAPSSFGFNVGGYGIVAHVIGSLRSDSDFGLSGTSFELLARGPNPVLGERFTLWGDPASESHDSQRGKCARGGIGLCPATEAELAPLLTTPAQCTATPPGFEAHVDSWEQSGVFHARRYRAADLAGNPTSLSGCNAEPFEPRISAAPTTDLADSPSGLEFDLHQLTDLSREHTTPSPLRDATVTLPAGLVANPSQADGRAACSPAQIGLLTPVGQASPVHLSKDPQSCPEAAKLGTLEVESPLLAQYKNDETEVVTDPETGEPLPRALHGAVYLAQPLQNPFGSLLALYLVIEDERSGIVAKLAGKIEPDPNTGQLTTVFEENPELPLSDVRISLFQGPRASLTTPQTCGAHTTATTLTPWSSPEGADAHPQSSFQTTAEPGGGACPASEGAASNSPAFSAGTLAPQAGAYSPFVLKLSRGDGSQRLAGIDTLLPPGLTGKLAGIAECSEAQIAQAKGREKPNEGILEREHPSCPASSEVGTVDVSAGSGPTPFHTQGHAYLAGPYKGAPLSLAVIVPAVAGPFDLGAVLSRVALHVDPETARIHAVSDPFPQILDGIPLDLRSVALKMDRPNFTLNPTNCDPLAITGAAISALGQSAALTSPFQVGGCQALPFKPKLLLRLKGGTGRAKNPALIATLTAKPGEANIAKASVALPHSEFLDQAHIKTICTRVQFAAGAGHGEQCPPGSVYGRARAITPLLDQPLEGPVFLRSSSNPLPDLVAALNGQIDVDLDGTVDSIHGGIRNRFEVVPDAPVSKFVLEMQGGKKGLLENSTDLCKSVNRATVEFTGQNGKVYDTKPALRSSCKGKKKHKKGGHKRHGGK